MKSHQCKDSTMALYEFTCWGPVPHQDALDHSSNLFPTFFGLNEAPLWAIDGNSFRPLTCPQLNWKG